MKRVILSLALLCAAGVNSIFATHMNVNDMIEFAHAIKGKTVTIPAELVEKKHNLKAMMIRMHAHHVRQMAKQLRPIPKHAYLKVAQEMSRLADHIEMLPALDLQMTFEHPEKMLLKKAIKAEIMGEVFEKIGEQVGMPKMVAKGEALEKWAEELRAALRKSACSMPMMDGQKAMMNGESMEMEGQDDMDEGQDDINECEDMDEGQDDYDNEGEETSAAMESEDMDDDSDDESEEAAPAAK